MRDLGRQQEGRNDPGGTLPNPARAPRSINSWSGFVVVTREMHRDAKSEELFKEVFLGLLIASSPYLGFASNVFGLRLVSVCLPHGVGDLLLPGLGIIDRLVLAKGMVKAVSCMTQLGLVYCDLKPGNFMPSHNRTVFVIDFGSVSRPGQ